MYGALFHQWLKPKGKLYLVSETPYCGIWQAIIPEYEVRKAQGEPWPAFMPNFDHYVSKDADDQVSPELLNPLDLWQLEKIAHDANFEVIDSSYIPRPEFPSAAQYDGRESAGLIAIKK